MIHDVVFYIALLWLVGLFVIFRAGYEVLAVWKALAPWPIEGGLIYRVMWGPATWMWAHNVGLALLGLWVAYGCMEVAKGVTMAAAKSNGGAQGPSPMR